MWKRLLKQSWFRRIVRKVANDMGEGEVKKRKFGDENTTLPSKQVRKCFDECKGKLLAFRHFDRDFDVLFLGSSHMAYGVNPYYFTAGRGFNFGSTSQCLMTSERVYKALSTGIHKRFGTVIVSYSVFSRGFLVTKTNERHVGVIFDYFLGGFAGLRRKESALFLQCELLDKGDFSNNFHDNGYFIKVPKPEINVDARTRALGHLKYHSEYDSQIGRLDLMLEHSKRQKQEVRIMLMPMRSDYRENLPPQHELFEELYNWACLRGVRIMDYYNAQELIDDDFYDFDHLNAQGARKLTAMISRDF